YAMNNLARCYKNGEGIEKNLEKAFYWYHRAAENAENGKINELLYDNCKRCEQSYIDDQFKSYFNFEKYRYSETDYLNQFQVCNSCSSGNIVVDFFIKCTNWEMKFIFYNKFEDIEFIAEGGFSKIYKGIWIDGPKRMVVALKELNNSK